MIGMNKLQANLCLLSVTIIWSSELIVLSCIPDSVEPVATTCITKTIGSILLFCCFFGRILNEIKTFKWDLFRKALTVALLNCVYNTMVIVGFRSFDSITGNFVYTFTAVSMPVLLLMLGRKVSKTMWVTSGLILIGIIIALTQQEGKLSIIGLITMMVACVIRGLFITKLADYAKENDPISITALMTLISGIISFALWAYVQPATFASVPWNKEILASIFIDSYFIVALSYVLNTFAQRKTEPMDAAVIYALEIAFTIILCAFLPKDIVGEVRITWLVIVAVGFVVAGNMAALFIPGGSGNNDKKSGDKTSAEADAGAHRMADVTVGGKEAQNV